MSFEYLDKLNPSQKQAATTIEGPLLIVAGAGSGKTTVLVNRLAYMIESGIPQENILLLTFTNAAADNMLDRAKKMIGENCDKITACTYHSFCAMEIRKFAKLLELPNDFTILSPGEVTDAIRLIKSELGFSQLKGISNNKIIAELISKAVNTGQDFTSLASSMNLKYIEELEQIRLKYIDYKQEHGLCDYDDLLLHMNSLLDFPEVQQSVCSHYTHIMVDEYQDTNRLQEQIVMKLCGIHKNLCVVGDAAQSIYKFRGADVTNIIDFTEHIGGCPAIPIMTNYRSTAEILDVANCVMKHHAQDSFKNKMDAHEKSGDKPNLIITDDGRSEAKFIFSKIQSLHKGGLPMDEIAVLSRSSNAMSELELKLEQAQIPYIKMGGLKFLDHVCIQDMLAYLRLLINPLDELAWYRVLCIIPGIGDIYAGKLSHIFSASTSPDISAFKTRKFFSFIEDLLQEVKNAKQLSLEDALASFTEYYVELRKQTIALANVSDEGNRENMQLELAQDIELLKQLQMIAEPYTKITDFLDSVALDRTAPEDAPALTLSTVHSAKGLEWNTVFVMDCLEEVFPKGNVEDFPDEFYEELRCFYVAITRAKEKLYLMAPQRLLQNGQYVEGIVNHVLQEAIKEGLLTQNKIQTEYKKVYLNVPFSQKEEAKYYGAKWDNLNKQWYYLSDGQNDQLFQKWLSPERSYHHSLFL